MAVTATYLGSLGNVATDENNPIFVTKRVSASHANVPVGRIFVPNFANVN
jgi:hypothetical protein